VLHRLVGGSLYALCVGLGLCWLLHLLITRQSVALQWTFQVALAAAIVCLSVAALVGRREHWYRPMSRLCDLLPRIRSGKAPIDELDCVGGGLTPLVPLLQDLLRDLRQQRANVARMQAEMQQRVAQRTDALERAIGSLRQQATRDSLTGLFNRRFLDTYLPQVMQRCRTERLDLAVLMIDLDNFKLLNDTLGHAAGDELLRAVGQIIRSGIRGEDAAFRAGGDEFLVLLPGCGPNQARALADRLTRLVDGLGRTLRVHPPARLCAGVALMAAGDADAAALLRRADNALYDEKRIRHGTSIPQRIQPATV
jgi:diguanylate cyclase (GGDEF)-like protein